MMRPPGGARTREAVGAVVFKLAALRVAMMLWVGVVCSVVGNTLNGVSFQVQRYAHVHNERNVSYLKLPLWWVGLVCMVSGEAGNFIAYGMAPASLVSPIGAIAVILNAMLSHIVLREPGSCKSYAGVVCALGGTILVILNAPTRPPTGGDDDYQIYSDAVSWHGLAFLLISGAGAVFMAILFNAGRYAGDLAKRHVVCYILVCCLAGAVSVISAKVVSTALVQAFAGDSSMLTLSGDEAWLKFTLLVGMIVSTFTQVAYFNLALMHFGASAVVPVYFVMHTLTSVAAGMVVFEETAFDPIVQKAVLFTLGLLLAFAGVYLSNLNVSECYELGCDEMAVCLPPAEDDDEELLLDA